MRVTAKVPKIKVNNDARVVNGEDGFSPVVTMFKVGSVTTLSIQDKYGLYTEEIKDGHTPTKGKDYFTRSDIEDIVTEVLNRVTDGNEVTY